jgi:hypothetical protein
MPEGGPNSGGWQPCLGQSPQGRQSHSSAKPEWAITVDPGRYLPNYEVDPVIRIRAIAGCRGFAGLTGLSPCQSATVLSSRAAGIVRLRKPSSNLI